jgi:hypothetical protein
MSKGTDVVIHIAKEETPNTLPALPVLRRNSDSLKKTVSLTQSDEIVDTRFEQGSIATSGEAVGNIEYDLSALSQDMFFEGVAGNLFVDSGTPSVSTLEIGGDTLPTYTIVKHDKKVGLIQVFTGCRIGELTIQGDTEGKITGSASISATGFSTPLTDHQKKIRDKLGRKLDEAPEHSYTANVILSAYNTIARSRKYKQSVSMPLDANAIKAYLEIYDAPCELYIFVECVLPNKLLININFHLKIIII